MLVTLASLGAVLALLLPFRAHLSTAIPALLFVLPALAGVVVGGFVPGAVGALGGFVFYDYLFLPPYNTLTVRSPQNWVALVVYLAVVLVVAQVVTQLQRAREDALRRTEETGRLYELSQALIGDLNFSQLLTHVVDTVQSVFAPRWTALVLPAGGRGALAPGEVLQVVAAAGERLGESDIAALTTGRRSCPVARPDWWNATSSGVPGAGGGRPSGRHARPPRRASWRNASGACSAPSPTRQLSLSTGPSCSEQALRTRLLEEIDRWRSALMGAASHDLRTPLASIKTAVSSLREIGAQLDPADRAELLELIELQSDRLARLVTNLLDMTRARGGSARASAHRGHVRRVGGRSARFPGRDRAARPCRRSTPPRTCPSCSSTTF